MKQPSHLSKMIAPIVVTVLLALWLLVYAGAVLLAAENFPFLLRPILLLIALALLGVLVYVLIERIREIKSGEEDDLDRY